MSKVVTVSHPAQASSCVIADSPHSGRRYPRDFNHACSRKLLRQAEDAYLDRLLDFFPQIGIPFIQAEFPRSYIDPNRPENATTLIRNQITPKYDVDIYDKPPSLSETFNRVAQYYKPYHKAICGLRSETRERCGRVVHLNCHSLPSVLLAGEEPYPYDIVIGTRNGITAAPQLAAKLKELFEEKGYRVALNAPGFSGAEILRRSGRPNSAAHAIQIEINRALYLDEGNVRLKPRASVRLKRDLREIYEAFRDYCDGPAFGPEDAVYSKKACRKP